MLMVKCNVCREGMLQWALPFQKFGPFCHETVATSPFFATLPFKLELWLLTKFAAAMKCTTEWHWYFFHELVKQSLKVSWMHLSSSQTFLTHFPRSHSAVLSSGLVLSLEPLRKNVLNLRDFNRIGSIFLNLQLKEAPEALCLAIERSPLHLPAPILFLCRWQLSLLHTHTTRYFRGLAWMSSSKKL